MPVNSNENIIQNCKAYYAHKENVNKWIESIPKVITETSPVLQQPSVSCIEDLKMQDGERDVARCSPQMGFDILKEVDMEYYSKNGSHASNSNESVISSSVSDNEEKFENMDDNSIQDPDYTPSFDTEMVCLRLQFIKYFNNLVFRGRTSIMQTLYISLIIKEPINL